MNSSSSTTLQFGLLQASTNYKYPLLSKTWEKKNNCKHFTTECRTDYQELALNTYMASRDTSNTILSRMNPSKPIALN